MDTQDTELGQFTDPQNAQTQRGPSVELHARNGGNQETSRRKLQGVRYLLGTRRIRRKNIPRQNQIRGGEPSQTEPDKGKLSTQPEPDAMKEYPEP